jgi:Pyruvate/2-oxoacid:ferredoxin oxidoreductase delta subunit
VKDNMANSYHGKVLRLEDARKIVSVEEDVELKNLEQVIPYKHAKDLILRSPDSIVAYECMCRARKENPCRPTDVCLVVGEPFAGAIAFIQHKKARKISREEAINILEEEDKRGHVHTAYFKDVMLNRFFAICNCCTCCCAGMKAVKEHNIPMIAASGYVSQISDECIGCGDCVTICPFEAIELGQEKTRIISERCFGCGICESRCSVQAISLVRDSQKGDPLDIEWLIAHS